MRIVCGVILVSRTPSSPPASLCRTAYGRALTPDHFSHPHRFGPQRSDPGLVAVYHAQTVSDLVGPVGDDHQEGEMAACTERSVGGHGNPDHTNSSL
jgi:hypothetical protein